MTCLATLVFLYLFNLTISLCLRFYKSIMPFPYKRVLILLQKLGKMKILYQKWELEQPAARILVHVRVIQVTWLSQDEPSQ